MHRSDPPPRWISTVVLTITVTFRKRVRKNLTEILMAMILSLYRHTVNSWLGCLPNGTAKSSVYDQVDSFGRYGDKLEGSVASILSGYCDFSQKVKARYSIIGDIPIKRSGSKNDGANYQHNPVSSKTDTKLYYGHSWVVLALAAYHFRWGIIALPLRHILYIRECDIEKRSPKQQEERSSRTKLAVAAELIQWTCEQFSHLDKVVALLADGVCTSNEVTVKAKKVKINVFTRLRKDFALFTVPKSPKQKEPGRLKKHGDWKEISVWEHSADDSWYSAVCSLYGKGTEVKYKAAVVTSRSTDGEPFKLIVSCREVKEGGPKVLFFCPDVSEFPEEIVKARLLRFSIEEVIKDLKEVEGIGGRPQIRKLGFHNGAFTLCFLVYTIVELGARDKSNDYLIQYTRGDYDDPNRRLSHSEKMLPMCLEINAGEYKRVYEKWRKPCLLKRSVRCIYSGAV